MMGVVLLFGFVVVDAEETITFEKVPGLAQKEESVDWSHEK
jgi:hypothetical protein